MPYALVGLLSGLFFMLASPVDAPAPGTAYPGLLIAEASDLSYNWAGYVAKGGRYSSAEATWVVPEVAGTQGPIRADATWVGIGGAVSDDLIQVGTQALVTPQGEVYYQAWTETIPAPSEPLALDIEPGDRVRASVREVGRDVWRLEVENLSSGKAAGRTVVYDSSHSSAEWIEEMPTALYGSFIPLNDFGTVRFSHAKATEFGVVRGIEELGAEPLMMINRRGEVLAAASVLEDNGFAVVRSTASPLARPLRHSLRVLPE